VISASTAQFGHEIAAIRNRALIPITNANIAPGARSSSPYGLLANGDSVLFTANDQSNGYELYRVTTPAEQIFRDGFE
jgi:hypothetical protein